MREGENGWDEPGDRGYDHIYLREATEGCLKQDTTYVQDKADCAVALHSFGKSL